MRRRLATAVMVAAAMILTGGAGALASSEPPAMTIEDAVEACTADEGPLDTDNLRVMDEGRSVVFQDFPDFPIDPWVEAEGVRCVLENLGMPEWILSAMVLDTDELGQGSASAAGYTILWQLRGEGGISSYFLIYES